MEITLLRLCNPPRACPGWHTTGRLLRLRMSCVRRVEHQDASYGDQSPIKFDDVFAEIALRVHNKMPP